jgi:peptidoglycan/LPS O-acetylase OafA/YrhL
MIFFLSLLPASASRQLRGGRWREGIFGLLFSALLDLYHLHFGYVQPSIAITGERTMFLWISTAAVFLATIYRPGPRVAKALLPLSLTGLISYPLYLIHQDVGQMLLTWAATPLNATFARAIVIPGLMIILASLVYFFVERNTIKPLTRFLSDPFPRKSIVSRIPPSFPETPTAPVPAYANVARDT